MQALDPIETNPLWQRFTRQQAKGRISQSMLLVGAQHTQILTFAQRMAMAILCKAQQTPPCGQCQACQLMAGSVSANEHPDFHYVGSDKPGGSVKIEQVRELQTLVFRTAQWSAGRVILINPADRMNTAASNALLKILEEPPEGVHFILIAESFSTISPTILSRCQQWRFADPNAGDYLSITRHYSKETDRGKVIAALDIIVEDLLALQQGLSSTSAIAGKWLEYPFADLIWLLYLLNAAMISKQFAADSIQEAVIRKLDSCHPLQLFARLDKLNEISDYLNHTISLNQQLTLETLLSSYVAPAQHCWVNNRRVDKGA